MDILPGPSIRRLDIVFTRKKIAVFIDGCYCHCCPECGTRAFRTNADYWDGKICRNVSRDADTTQQLMGVGWTVLRYWEHVPPDEVAEGIAEVVQKPR